MKSVSEITRQPRDRNVHFFLLTGLVSVCMAVIGCGDCSAKTSPQVSEPKFIPPALAPSKVQESSKKAGDGTVTWRGVDSGYCHVTNGN